MSAAEGELGGDLRAGPVVTWLSCVALALPAFLLFWMLPLEGGRQISMDYPRVSVPQQQELLFSMLHGSFPLFVPGFAGGQSAGALTAGQLYHPISYLAAALPGYWEGRAQDLNTLLRLISLGLANLLLYRLVRRLVRGELIALLLATVTVFNLRMLNVFHGAAALEGFTGMLYTVAALGWCWLRPARWGPRLGVVLATYCTLVSGHPQFAYYSLLGTLLAVLLMPALVQGARGLPRAPLATSLRYWAHMAFLAGLAGLLAAAYALPFQLDFMSSNMRVGREYEFSLWWNDTLAGALNNFFRPLRSATSVSFGGSVLALIGALAPALALVGVRLPRYFWAAWAALLVVFLHALGDLTPVHWFFWKFFPLFSSVRGPGRLTVVLPLLLLVILVGVFRAAPAARGPCARLAPLTLLAVLALLATGIHCALPSAWTAAAMDNAPVNFEPADPRLALAETPHLLWGLVALGALAIHGHARGARSRSLALAAGLVLFTACSMQTWIALRFGIWTESRRPTQTLAELRADKLERLAFSGNPGGGLYSATILKRLEHSSLDPFLARLYTRDLSARDSDEAWALMDAGRPLDTIIVESAESIGAAGAPGASSRDERVRLTHGSFNRVTFAAQASAPAWLELTFPYSGLWRASVDGAATEVVPANGAYQAVRVPAGESQVEFRYVSRNAELGMLISCLGVFAVGAWLALGLLRGGPRWVGLGLTAALAGGGYFAWYASLYSGEHLGTEYLWTPPAAEARVNLALQRPNQMSPIYPVTWNDTQASGRTPDPWGSGKGVDGDRTPGRGFRTSVDPDPHWIVDLAGAPEVSEVAVHGARLGADEGARLALDLWTAGAWERVGERSALDPEVERFTFEPRRAARVRLQALGTRGLAADEVEVYGPAD